MQQLIVWQEGKLFADCSLAKLESALEDKRGAVVWLDLQVETHINKYEDLLRNQFKLSPLTLDTIAEERERARLMSQHGYFYLVMHGLEFNRETLDAETPKLDVVFDRNFLITIHRQDMPWLDELLESTRRDPSEDNIMNHGLPMVLHAVLDTLVDSYFPILDELDDFIDDLEDATVEKANSEVQISLFSAKRAMAKMRRVISPQVEVSNSLITRTGDYIPTETEPYFADVHDHLVRTFEVLDSYRDLLSGLLDVYLTTISNRQNEIMKQLALISTIFLPITFVTGIFGQNFAHSPQVEHDNGLNFWLVLLLMVVITIFQVWYFRKRKWL